MWHVPHFLEFVFMSWIVGRATIFRLLLPLDELERSIELQASGPEYSGPGQNYGVGPFRVVRSSRATGLRRSETQNSPGREARRGDLRARSRPSAWRYSLYKANPPKRS